MTLPEVFVLLLLGTAHAADPRTDLAAAAAAVRAHPEDVSAQELYLDLLIGTGQSAAALEAARARLAIAPRDADANYLVGRATMDPAAAQVAYEAALRLDPDHARASMGLASVAEARGKTADAEAGYSRAAARDPSLVEAWVGWVRVLIRQGRDVDALAAARRGLLAHPNEVGLVLAAAQLAPREAVGMLERALIAHPEDPRLHATLAEQRLADGRASDALTEARAALAVDPTSAAAARTELYAREQVEGRLDAAGRAALEAARVRELLDPGAAIGPYTAVIEAHPRSALALLARAGARKAKGDPGAIDDLARAAAIDPQNVEAAAAAGLALLNAKRADEASPLLDRAAAARPWDPGLAVGALRARNAIGRGEEAIAPAMALVQRFPEDPRTHLVLVEVLVTQQHLQDAYIVAKRALIETGDPTIAAVFVQIAPAAGHPDEAAALLESIVAKTGNPSLAAAAAKLRATP